MSNLSSTSKLTEFPALEAEERVDGRFSLSKFMFWRKGDELPTVEASASSSGPIPSPSSSIPAGFVERTGPTTIPSVSNSSTNISSVGRKISVTIPPYRPDSNLSNPSPDSMDGPASPGTFEARNVSNVLRRLTNLIAMGSSNQADLKKYWMPDSVSKECYECGEKFTTFRRKHHCRICGQIFCSRCCNQEIPGKVIGYTGDLRVCVYCCKIVLSYLRSSDTNADGTTDLNSIQEDLQHRFGGLNPDFVQIGGTQLSTPDHSSSYRSLTRRKASACYQEERFAGSKEHSFDSFQSNTDDKPKIVWDWVSLKSMWEEMLNPVTGIDWATHRHNMMKYCHSCVVGSELIDWLLAQRKITWRGQGVQIGQLLIDANLLECVSQAEQVFVDAYALYKPVQVPLSSVHEISEPESISTRSSTDYGDVREWGQDPSWLKQVSNPHKLEELSENDTEKEDSTQEDNIIRDKRLPSTNSMYAVDLNLFSSTVSMSKPIKPKESSSDVLDATTTTANVENVDGSTEFNSSSSLQPKNTPSLSKLGHSNITTETMTDEFLQKTLQSQKDKGKDMVPPTGWHSPQQLTTDSELRAFQTLCNSHINHENNLLNQLLERMDICPSWADVILPIVHKVTEIVKPDVRNADDEMDIRQYIQFKKLPGGKKGDCRIVNGVVCTKNVAHRQMRNRLKDPNILLIGSSIDYQRFENRFLSLEPLVMQEHDYLKNTVARIAAMKPDIVIVEKTVSRLAQEFMLDQGITLIINVKPSIMERVGRITQGLIWESADTQLGRPQLGLCHNFYLETFKINGGKRKTLMFFDGCATHLGCTVLLRGGTSAELIKVKKITSFLVFVAYNWRLERSFHIDSFSMPPEQTEKSNSTSSSEDYKSQEALESHNNDNNCFQSTLEHVILSASPFITYPLPYLETEAGKVCELRKFFPDILYWSSRAIKSNVPSIDLENNNIEDSYDAVLLNSKACVDKPRIHWEEKHSFTTSKLTSSISADEVQELIADFRRKGSRLELIAQGNFMTSEDCNRSDASSWNTVEHDKLKPGNGEEQIDALDPLKHQRLSVLFCSYSPVSANAPYFCVNPWVVNMDMYGRNDISLGMFLETYCFRKTYVCPARQCDTPMMDHIRKFVHYNSCVEVVLRELQSPILGSGQNVLMWNWCAICRTVSPIVPMSIDAWSVSFAKYLELRFYGQAYSRRGFDNPCPHSLHQDHQQYFAQHNVVAAFKFCPIQLWEISLPPCPISVKKIPKNVAQHIEDVKSVAILGYGVYSNIFEVLTSLKENSSGLKVEDMLSAMLEQQKTERTGLRSKIEDIQVNLASQTVQDSTNSKEVETHLWKVKDSISFLKCNISETIQTWNTSLNNFIAQKKKEEKQTKDTSKTLSRLESELHLPIFKDFEESVGKISTSDNVSIDLSVGTPEGCVQSLNQSISSLSDDKEVSSCNTGLEVPQDGLIIKRSAPPSPNNSALRKSETERSRHDVPDKNFEDPNNESGKSEKRSSSSTVKTLISHFMSGPGVQIIQNPWQPLEHYFPAAYSIIPFPVFENEPSSIVAFTLGCTEYKSKLKQHSSCANSAFLASIEDDAISSKRKKVTGASDEFQASVGSLGKQSITDDKAHNELEDDKNGKKGDGNIEIQFSNAAAKFYCRIYFADNFRQLRKSCLLEDEEIYVRSLSRCVSWAALGGKSGSTFCKTMDDRFVIKQMSRFEIQSFLDFAPNYFEYMKTALAEKKPTVLVKIMGVYRIGFKNFLTNAAAKMDILVMENLFYERNINQKFDLKGSIRNRLANVTGKEHEDLVLLDENLVNMACENPIYIRPHTKSILSLALSNDSRFLASQLVMDYSLLVGLDETNGKLIVGIIDYIRTFTWDKKIETFVKSSGILGGQGKTPTVVSPTEYQTRFCEAMDRYFLLVPDRWLGLGLDMDP